MKCSRVLAALVLASVLLPPYLAFTAWMRSLVDERDACSVAGFVGWSAYFFYQAARIALWPVRFGVDKSRPVK